MAVEVDKILKRFKAAEMRKQPWDLLYRDALNHAAPYHQLYYSMDGQDKANADIVFDSTAQNALDSFVSNLQSSLVPPVKEWVKLQAGNRVPSDNREASDESLEKITQEVFDYIKISNFDTQISTSFADLAFGVGALLVNKGTEQNPLHFTSVHIAELFLEEGPNGRIDTAFRKTSMPLRNIEDTWEDARISETLKNSIEKNPDERITLIEAVIGKEIEVSNVRKGVSEKDYGYCYLVFDEKTKEVLVEREQPSSPWVIFRWPTLPGEIYARGPLLKALPDIKTLNKVKELLLRKGSRDVGGFYTYLDDGCVNIDNIEFGPLTFIPVETNGGVRGPAIAPLPSTGDLNLGQFLFNDLQQAIYKTMFAEPLGRVDLPVKTATEIAYRQQELAKKIGSAFGKLQFELMAPLISRILYILDEMGLIDLGGYKVDGRMIDIVYRSPLALAQESEELDNIVRYVNTMNTLYGPQIGMAMSKPDEVAKEVGKRLHIPSNILPTADEVASMKQALLQQSVQNSAQVNQLPPVEAGA